MRNNIGWFLLGAMAALLWWSAGYNWMQSERYDKLIQEIESMRFDYDVCIERVQQLTAHERLPKK
jgi:hypothetical protein